MEQKSKIKKVRLWLYQTNLSGNSNGHFDLFEGETTSTKEDVIKANKPYYHNIYNIQDLGVFPSAIGDKDFPTDSFLKKFKWLKK